MSTLKSGLNPGMLPPTSTPTHASGWESTLNHPGQPSTQRLGRTSSDYFSSECSAEPLHPLPTNPTFDNGQQQDAFRLFGNSPTFSLPTAHLFNYAHDSNPPTERSLRLGGAIDSFKRGQDISNSTITPPSLFNFHDSVNPFQLEKQTAYLRAYISASNTGTPSEIQNTRREAFYAPTSGEGTNYYNYEVPYPAYQEQIDLLYSQSPLSTSGIAQQHPSLWYPQPLSAAPYNINNIPADNAPNPLIQPLAIHPPTMISGLALQHHLGHYLTMDTRTAGSPSTFVNRKNNNIQNIPLHIVEKQNHTKKSYRTFITGNSTSSENDYIEQERSNGKSSDGSSPQETGSVGSERLAQPPEICLSSEGSAINQEDEDEASEIGSKRKHNAETGSEAPAQPQQPSKRTCVSQPSSSLSASTSSGPPMPAQEGVQKRKRAPKKPKTLKKNIGGVFRQQTDPRHQD